MKAWLLDALDEIGFELVNVYKRVRKIDCDKNGHKWVEYTATIQGRKFKKEIARFCDHCSEDSHGQYFRSPERYFEKWGGRLK